MEAWIIFPKIQFPAHIKRHTRSQCSEQEREWFWKTLCVPPARVLQLEILHARRALQGLQCVSKERGSKEINFSLRIWKKRLCAFSFSVSVSPSAAAGRKMPHWAMVRFKFSAVPLAVHLTRSGAINHSGQDAQRAQ
jgi:hypothetical protein